MELQIGNSTNEGINLGTVIVFPQYGTSYVVHVADSASVEKYMNEGEQGKYQLYRIDGRKPYRKIPFTRVELMQLVDALDGRVYSTNDYRLVLKRK